MPESRKRLQKEIFGIDLSPIVWAHLLGWQKKITGGSPWSAVFTGQDLFVTLRLLIYYKCDSDRIDMTDGAHVIYLYTYPIWITSFRRGRPWKVHRMQKETVSFCQLFNRRPIITATMWLVFMEFYKTAVIKHSQSLDNNLCSQQATQRRITGLWSIATISRQASGLGYYGMVLGRPAITQSIQWADTWSHTNGNAKLVITLIKNRAWRSTRWVIAELSFMENNWLKELLRAR